MPETLSIVPSCILAAWMIFWANKVSTQAGLGSFGPGIVPPDWYKALRWNLSVSDMIDEQSFEPNLKPENNVYDTGVISITIDSTGDQPREDSTQGSPPYALQLLADWLFSPALDITVAQIGPDVAPGYRNVPRQCAGGLCSTAWECKRPFDCLFF